MQTPRLRIAFAGTPEFAAHSLACLIAEDHHDIVAVYTQPDRPAGRGRSLRKSAVKELAEANGLPVLQPSTFKDAGALQTLRDLNLDLLIVVAYGQILPSSVLETPRLGCINVHASLLPRWRGAAPIQRAIETGDAVSGVTIMQVEPALDSGPMYRKEACVIDSQDTAQTLHDKLADLGAASLCLTLTDLATGSAVAEPQDESLVTYAEKITKAEAKINWAESADQIHRKIRAFYPVPVAYADLFEQSVRIWRVERLQQTSTKQAGSIERLTRDGLDIVTGDGKLIRILELQMPGKRRVSIIDFVNGNPKLVTSSSQNAAKQ